MGHGTSTWRMIVASITASVVGLELGAVLVTLETELSGVTALPTGDFLALMTSIHLFIGIGRNMELNFGQNWISPMSCPLTMQIYV